MELAVMGILIVLIVLVTCLLHNANSRAKKWESRCDEIRKQYYALKDTNRTNENEVGRLYKTIGELRWKISSLEEKLELERKYNRKANDAYINKNKGWKEEIKNLKKSKPISRSKAVQYITQHSNFTPTQMNNQSTDNLLDYYWYLYLMNTTITEDSKDSVSVNNVCDTAQAKADDLYEQHQTSNTNSVEETKSSTDDSTNSSSNFPDDSWNRGSGYHGGSSLSSSGSSSSGWGSSDYSSSGSYDSGSSSDWGSSGSSSCDSGGCDW